jgi:hypothetical protein
MAEGEKFSFSKFFGSFFRLIPWLKDVRTILGVILVIFMVTMVWRVFFAKTQTQTQQMTVYPFSFSTITYAPQQSQKQEAKKRSWWLPSVFGEIYGFAETTGLDEQRTGLGTRAGLKWEF